MQLQSQACMMSSIPALLSPLQMRSIDDEIPAPDQTFCAALELGAWPE